MSSNALMYMNQKFVIRCLCCNTESQNKTKAVPTFGFAGSRNLKVSMLFNIWLFFKDFTYLFLERGGRNDRGRGASMCGHLSCVPYWGPGPQPRYVPWLGIELETLLFAGRHSIHWATPARVQYLILKKPKNLQILLLLAITLHDCYEKWEDAPSKGTHAKPIMFFVSKVK